MLIIDDELMNLEVFKAILAQEGVQVDSATSGDAGLTLVKARCELER